MRAAEVTLTQRGTAQRVHRNALVFLAADAAHLSDLKTRVCALLAWTSICDERDAPNLDPFQSSTAAGRLKEAERTVDAQLPDCWQWLLAPEQPVPTDPTLAWTPLKLSGADPLPLRAMKKLSAEEKVITNYGRQRLEGAMAQFGLWGNEPHVLTQTLWGYFARYPYRTVGRHQAEPAFSGEVRRRLWALAGISSVSGLAGFGGLTRGTGDHGAARRLFRPARGAREPALYDPGPLSGYIYP